MKSIFRSAATTDDSRCETAAETVINLIERAELSPAKRLASGVSSRRPVMIKNGFPERRVNASDGEVFNSAPPLLSLRLRFAANVRRPDEKSVGPHAKNRCSRREIIACCPDTTTGSSKKRASTTERTSRRLGRLEVHPPASRPPTF